MNSVEGDGMGKKYTLDKSGYYKTTVWDGTYKDGKKHRVTIRSRSDDKNFLKNIHFILDYWCPIVYYIIIKNNTGGKRNEIRNKEKRKGYY